MNRKPTTFRTECMRRVKVAIDDTRTRNECYDAVESLVAVAVTCSMALKATPGSDMDRDEVSRLSGEVLDLLGMP